MERTDKLNQLRQFNRPWEYDCCDIAEKLVELSNLPDDGQLKNELTDALYYLKAVAENPYTATIIVCYSMCCWSSRGLSVSKSGRGAILSFFYFYG